MTDEERDRLHRRLERLGDMIGNGEHHEEGGEWIEKEYKTTFYTLYPEMRPKKDFQPEVRLYQNGASPIDVVDVVEN